MKRFSEWVKTKDVVHLAGRRGQGDYQSQYSSSQREMSTVHDHATLHYNGIVGEFGDIAATIDPIFEDGDGGWEFGKVKEDNSIPVVIWTSDGDDFRCYLIISNSVNRDDQDGRIISVEISDIKPVNISDNQLDKWMFEG